MKNIELKTGKDFNLKQTLECGQCFRWEKIEESEYLIFAEDKACLAKDEKDYLKIQSFNGDEEFWNNYFDLSTDYSKYKEELLRGEPRLNDAILYGGGIRILNQDFFEVLISFIISQNNNIPRIKKCIESISSVYGKPIGIIRGRKRFAFPSANTLALADSEELMKLKLGYRSAYIVKAAHKFQKEKIPSGKSDEKYKQILSYYGIGPKVANCISLFGLRDFEAFPIDTWVKRIMVHMYGFDEKDISGMQKFATEKFGSLGGLAQQYLFYYYRDRKIKK